MKKTSRLLVALLVSAMLAACLTGCASKEQPAAEAPAPSESASAPIEESEAPVQSEAPAEPEQAQEPAALSYPFADETVTLSVYTTEVNFHGAMANCGVSSWSDFNFFNEVEKLTNVHIDLNAVTFMSYTEQFNLYIAGGEYDDIIVGLENQYVGGLPVALADDVIIDLTDLVPDYSPNYNAALQDANVARDCLSDGGLILDFKSMYDDYIVKNGSLIRGDLLEQAGMDVPTTVSQLEDAMMAFKTEFGMENPIYMDSQCTVPAQCFGAATYKCGGSDLGFAVVDGAIQTTLNSDAYYKALETVTRWYANGLVNPEFATVTFDPRDPVLNEKILNGGVGYWDTQLEGIDDYNNGSTIEGYNAVPMGTLVENEGDTYHFSGSIKVDVNGNDVCVSTQCEYPEIALKWMDYWYSPEGTLMYNYGVEGETYDMVDGQIQLKDEIVNNDIGVDIASYLRIYCPYGSFFGKYLAGRMDFMASDLYLEAKQVWAQNSDTERIVPAGVSLTTDESAELSSITADISTFVSERIPRMIMGEVALTEWDATLEQIESMGLSRAVEIEQAAYDRYIGK